MEPGQGLPHPPDRLAHPLLIFDEGKAHVTVPARAEAKESDQRMTRRMPGPVANSGGTVSMNVGTGTASSSS